jgi:predicted nucleic acid-binding protein
MRQGEVVFVDSGAWIALALSRDPLHSQAREQWELLRGAGAKLHSSVPVVIETFTFLDRNANRDVALTWKDLQARHGKDSSMRVARSGAVLGIFSTRGSAQAVRRRRHQLCDHEARANSARIRVRSSLCRRRVQVGDIAASSTATGLEPERSAARKRSSSPARARVRSSPS